MAKKGLNKWLKNGSPSQKMASHLMAKWQKNGCLKFSKWNGKKDGILPFHLPLDGLRWHGFLTLYVAQIGYI